MGTSQGVGLNTAFHTSPHECSAESLRLRPPLPGRCAQEGVVPVQCRAAVLIDQGSGTVLYEKSGSAGSTVIHYKSDDPALTFEAVHGAAQYADHGPRQ